MKTLIFFLSIFCWFLTPPLFSQTTSNTTTWEDISISNLEIALHKITAVSNQLWGVEYGSGKIFKSEDKGDNWKEIAALGSEYFEKIQFLDEMNGFVCGDYGRVYKTQDGGLTWQEISPIIENRIIEKFREDSTKNQEPDGLFVAYYGMYFEDVNKGFVSGYQYNPKLGFRDSFTKLFYQTNDAGKTWQALTKEDHQKLLENYKRTLKKSNFTFDLTYYWDDLHYWTIDEDLQGNYLVRYSTDGGTSEKTSMLPKTEFERVMLRKFAFTDAKTGYFVGGALDENNEKAIIFKTVDGGENWTYEKNDLPHIHDVLYHQNYLWMVGKEKLVKRKLVDSR